MINVYVSDDKIKFVDGKASGKKLVIKSCHEVRSKTGSIETGNIKDLMAFSQVMQEAIQDYAIKVGPATFIVDNSRLVLKEMDVPDVAPVKIKQIVANEIFTDAKSSTNTLDYMVESRFKNEEKKKRCKVNVTFLPSEVISNIYKCGSEVLMKPKILDIAPNALSKLVERMIKDKKTQLEETFIVVEYKETFLSLLVFDKGQRQLSKSTILYVSEDAIDVYYVVSEIVNNVNSLIRFYESRNENRNITAIYLTGQVEPLNDSMQDLADNLRMIVAHLPCPSYVMGVDLMEFNAYSSAIGGLIRK